MVLDGADGRIARLTNTTSAFGAEYDSLADMVSFGIAPALVLYSWSLVALGKPGWVVSFIFAAAVALRLARFNTQLSRSDKRFFQGLPAPGGAGVIASLVWIFYDLDISLNPGLNVLMAIIAVSLGLLMISEVRYYSIKKIDLQGKVPFIVLLVILLIITAVALEPPTLLFIILGFLRLCDFRSGVYHDSSVGQVA
jgi:CDP-diacylglycerol---serine O-phosphatidyltransferase